MSLITKITDHTQRALDRLRTQYQGKPRFEAIIKALGDQVQDIEDAAFDLISARTLTNAVGAQLDLIGRIVNQAREGFDDDFYRVLLYVKIGQNTSQGDGEKLISIYKLLTGASLVFYDDRGNGAVALSSNVPIAEDFVNFIIENLEAVASGGVRVEELGYFDPSIPFAFLSDTGITPGAGFSDISGTTGGKLASLYRVKKPFAFVGGSENSAGFGSLKDPLIGGQLKSIGA